MVVKNRKLIDTIEAGVLWFIWPFPVTRTLETVGGRIVSAPMALKANDGEQQTLKAELGGLYNFYKKKNEENHFSFLFRMNSIAEQAF